MAASQTLEAELRAVQGEQNTFEARLKSQRRMREGAVLWKRKVTTAPSEQGTNGKAGSTEAAVCNPKKARMSDALCTPTSGAPLCPPMCRRHPSSRSPPTSPGWTCVVAVAFLSVVCGVVVEGHVLHATQPHIEQTVSSLGVLLRGSFNGTLKIPVNSSVNHSYTLRACSEDFIPTCVESNVSANATTASASVTVSARASTRAASQPPGAYVVLLVMSVTCLDPEAVWGDINVTIATQRRLPDWNFQVGTSSWDSAQGMAVDASGNAFIAGGTEGDLVYTGDFDAFIIKVNASGHEMWRYQVGTTSDDDANGIAVDSSGNAFIAGYTRGNLTSSPNAGNWDAFLIKVSASGHELWRYQVGTTSSDYIFDVAVDSSGNAFIAGATEGNLTSSPNVGDFDLSLIKVNASGHELWRYQVGTTGYEYIESVAVDSSGNAFIAGGTDGSLASPNSQPGYDDAFLIKVNASGHELWRYQVGTTSNDFASGVAVDASGNAFIAGSTRGSLASPNAGGYDAFIVKVNASGHELWRYQVGTTSNDFASGVAVDASGNAFIAGHTQGSLASPNAGSYDAFLIRVSASGRELWRYQVGTTSEDRTEYMAVDSSGNAFIAGYTKGAAVFGQANGGGSDAFLTRLSYGSVEFHGFKATVTYVESSPDFKVTADVKWATVSWPFVPLANVALRAALVSDSWEVKDAAPARVNVTSSGPLSTTVSVEAQCVLPGHNYDLHVFFDDQLVGTAPNVTQSMPVDCVDVVLRPPSPSVDVAVKLPPFPRVVEDSCVWISSLANGTSLAQGSNTTVVYNVTDAQGQSGTVCTFSVSVLDIQPPTITHPCPTDIIVDCAPGVGFANVSWTPADATDNAGVLTTTTPSETNGSSFAAGVHNLTYTFTDGASNAASCSFHVTVRDRQPPHFTVGSGCPRLDVSRASRGPVVWSEPTATDNVPTCTPVVRRSGPPPGTLFDIAARVTVNYTAVDCDGNVAVCTVHVSVGDAGPGTETIHVRVSLHMSGFVPSDKQAFVEQLIAELEQQLAQGEDVLDLRAVSDGITADTTGFNVLLDIEDASLWMAWVWADKLSAAVDELTSSQTGPLASSTLASTIDSVTVTPIATVPCSGPNDPSETVKTFACSATLSNCMTLVSSECLDDSIAISAIRATVAAYAALALSVCLLFAAVFLSRECGMCRTPHWREASWCTFLIAMSVGDLVSDCLYALQSPMSAEWIRMGCYVFIAMPLVPAVMQFVWSWWRADRRRLVLPLYNREVYYEGKRTLKFWELVPQFVIVPVRIALSVALFCVMWTTRILSWRHAVRLIEWLQGFPVLLFSTSVDASLQHDVSVNVPNEILRMILPAPHNLSSVSSEADAAAWLAKQGFSAEICARLKDYNGGDLVANDQHDLTLVLAPAIHAQSVSKQDVERLALAIEDARRVEAAAKAIPVVAKDEPGLWDWVETHISCSALLLRFTWEALGTPGAAAGILEHHMGDIDFNSLTIGQQDMALSLVREDLPQEERLVVLRYVADVFAMLSSEWALQTTVTPFGVLRSTWNWCVLLEVICEALPQALLQIHNQLELPPSSGTSGLFYASVGFSLWIVAATFWTVLAELIGQRKRFSDVTLLPTMGVCGSGPGCCYGRDAKMHSITPAKFNHNGQEGGGELSMSVHEGVDGSGASSLGGLASSSVADARAVEMTSIK